MEWAFHHNLSFVDIPLFLQQQTPGNDIMDENQHPY